MILITFTLETVLAHANFGFSGIDRLPITCFGRLLSSELDLILIDAVAESYARGQRLVVVVY